VHEGDISWQARPVEAGKATRATFGLGEGVEVAGDKLNRLRLAGHAQQSSDRVEQLQPVTDCRDAKLLLRSRASGSEELAECRLVLPKAQAPQPDHNVHDGAYNRGGAHHLPRKRGCPGWRWDS
jgi:hypothetical protein